MTSYNRLEQEQSKPRPVRDHTETWSRLAPIGDVQNDKTRQEIAGFCQRKRVTVGALNAIGARYAVRRESPCLAFAGGNGNGKIVAIKYRPINGSSHDSTAEPPSVWLHPIVIGNRSSLDWLVAEGETDAARLYDLVGDRCAILVLPEGAQTFKREWADSIPRGATVGLCHDNDPDGDDGAEKAEKIIGGKTFRIRPPVEGGDWCDWDGDRDAFLNLIAAASGDGRPFRLEVLTARAVCDLPIPPADDDDLLGPLFRRGQRFVFGAHTGHGKTTIITQAIKAITERGRFLDWQGVGGRALVVDAEQGLRTVQKRLREARLDQSEHVDYVRVPDGLELNCNPEHIAEVGRVIADGGYSIVFMDPLYKLHVGNSNDERETVDLMRQLDRWREQHHFLLALAAHCRKPPIGSKFTMHEFFGSSASLRGAEVALGLQRLSDGYGQLHFFKDRDGDGPPIDSRWGLLFDRSSETHLAPY